jgi:hypothetical protein
MFINLIAMKHCLNARGQFIIRAMGVCFHIEGITRMIDVVFYFFGGKLASGKYFEHP